jgi:hypothetical protein
MDKTVSRQMMVTAIVVLLGIIALCLFGVIQINAQECKARNNQIPDAPISPGSLLVNTVESGNPSPFFGYVEYTYETTASPDDVIGFYEEHRASCYDDIGKNQCTGEADPFGVYEIYVEEQPGVTSIRAVISWDKCPDEDMERSVER